MRAILLVLLCLLAACSTNPVTGKKEMQLVTEDQEIALGEQNYHLMQQAQGGDYVADPDVQEYVEKVGMRLAEVSDRPNLPYEFVVLNNSIPNAWALPGGKIAINRGLLIELNSEAELAAVLAHEIVHSAARHGAKMMERMMLMQAGLLGLQQTMKDHKYEDVVLGAGTAGVILVGLKYSREAELEADKYGIKYMVAAGYDPQAAVDLQKTFLRISEERPAPKWLDGLLSTHPPSEERIRANEKSAASYPPGGEMGVEEYAKAMSHLKNTKWAYQDLDNGYKALLAGRYEKALTLAEAGINIEPNEGHLYNLKGKAEVKMHRLHDALHSFTKAIDCNPNYFDFYLQRGLLEERLGDYNASRRDLDKSRELLPSAEAYYALGELALRAGDRHSALTYFQMAGKANTPVGEKARQRVHQLQWQGP